MNNYLSFFKHQSGGEIIVNPSKKMFSAVRTTTSDEDNLMKFLNYLSHFDPVYRHSVSGYNPATGQTVSTDYSIFQTPTAGQRTVLAQPRTGTLTFKQGVTLDNVHDDLVLFVNLLLSKGLDVRITEGYSTSGHTGNSKHYSGKGIDFTPADNDYDRYDTIIASDPEILAFIKEHNIYILNEKKNPSLHSTGPHFHVLLNS